MTKKKKPKRTEVTSPSPRDESIQEFMLRKYKSTKFILIAESLDEDGRAVEHVVTDGKKQRALPDYFGMIIVAIFTILQRLGWIK